jgi:fatty-acyl-CoA synthase
MTAPLPGPTYPSIALRALARFPDRVAFRAGDVDVSYAAALDTIGRMQAAMSARGVGRGSVVAVLSANRWDSWGAGIAAQGLGAAVTPLHPIGSLESHEFQLLDAGVDTLVADVSVYRERAADLAARVPHLKLFTVGGALDLGARSGDLLALAREAGTQTARDLARPDDLASLNYTGGTTGRSKGAYRNSSTLALSNLAVLGEFEFPKRPAYLAVAPISHVAGSNVLPTLIKGGTVHLMGGFDPERVLATIERERIDFTLMVPTMVYALLDHPKLKSFDLSSLELLLYGASPMSPTRLAEALENIGPVFSQLYGQSECYPIASLPKADHDVKRPELLAACGFPTAACQVKLLDDASNEVPQGEAGEICVRAPHAMAGYWKQPELTAEAMAGGWLHTGDVARADEQGRLYIVDRKKDMIISGGFNVYPKEVEDVLTQHPAVSSAAVIGVPDDKWGEAVKAVVVLRPGASVPPEELAALVREHKGAVYAPKTVDFAESLPVTALGKPDKKALRAKYWSGEGRGVH